MLIFARLTKGGVESMTVFTLSNHVHGDQSFLFVSCLFMVLTLTNTHLWGIKIDMFKFGFPII